MAHRAITSFPSLSILLTSLLSFHAYLAAAASEQQPLKEQEKTAYKIGQAIPVTCLNRTIDTGEHITDELGQLQYIDFPTCSETGRPLELAFGVDKEINCTLDFISDPFFHLLEFYIHNDAPLTCRIPTRPLTPDSSSSIAIPVDSTNNQVGALGSQSTLYTPLVVALTGTLQLSHVHVANYLNLLLHAAPKSTSPGTIDAASAYSVSSGTRHTKVIIGDALTLHFSVRWYPSPVLPSGWAGVGGHIFLSTLVYCLLSAGAATAVCIAYFRGVALPRRLQRYAKDKVGNGLGGYGYGAGGLPQHGNGTAKNGYAGYGGYGYGVSTGTGKRD
ncbi:hypothetical protein EJ05DRAFT_506847 [Pseudovirgaria hyperparasitica]|uniref:Uncharacterized protein n=1 Tax=Pseudovirgaria hyperparasitica TaxID=470096 RepID=A0A6A6WM50_9PEZI|nr:uncharacterized protein EJ05DRAFT_506847 [Pseudovirgaria hyperparasitica]KAF2763233.1 hypothetical protein EJ05DRAFT_506847 [Pseudovirgaria hyperparasitica]